MPPVAKKQPVAIGDALDTAPSGSEWTGEFVDFGGKHLKVWRETKQVSKLVPLIDPETNRPALKRNVQGNPTGRYHTTREYLDQYDEREFIQIDSGNGTVYKHYNFRPAPGEAEAKAKADRKAKFLDSLFERAEAAGGLDNLLAAESDDDEAQTFPESKGFGRWLLSDGSTFTGKKPEAQAAEEALHVARKAG